MHVKARTSVRRANCGSIMANGFHQVVCIFVSARHHHFCYFHIAEFLPDFISADRHCSVPKKVQAYTQDCHKRANGNPAFTGRTLPCPAFTGSCASILCHLHTPAGTSYRRVLSPGEAGSTRAARHRRNSWRYKCVHRLRVGSAAFPHSSGACQWRKCS